jgi:tetratricopeptide (TPR) repeat protein
MRPLFFLLVSLSLGTVAGADDLNGTGSKKSAAARKKTTPKGKLDNFNDALTYNRPAAATAICASVVAEDPYGGESKQCVQQLESHAADALQNVTIAAGIGKIREAVSWCDAIQTVDPNFKNLSATCDPIQAQWLKYSKGQLDLSRARQLAQSGDTANAIATLSGDNITKSGSPATLMASIGLLKDIGAKTLSNSNVVGIKYAELKMADQAEALCKPMLATDPSHAVPCMKAVAEVRGELAIKKDNADLAVAEAQVQEGNLTDPRNTALRILETSLQDDVRERAQKVLDSTRPSFRNAFHQAINSLWIKGMAGSLAAILGTSAVLVIFRALWRRMTGGFYALRKIRPRWSIGTILENPQLGGRDQILDALRRMPNEARAAMWTPKRLWIEVPPGKDCCQVIEQVDADGHVDKLHEDPFRLAFSNGRASDAALLYAFQNIQLPGATAGVAKFVRAVFDWWHDGDPTLSGFVKQLPASDQPSAAADGTKQVAVRLTCADFERTVSTLATTDIAPGIDALRISAERAAYKLALSLLPPGRKDCPDTAEQIDAHAAFRQGAKALSCQVATVTDTEADKQVRQAELKNAIDNLEFARQVFARDAGHRKYYLASMRLQAVAYALTGRITASFARLEELENTTTGRDDAREKELCLEAIYNQAILHMKAGIPAAAANTPVEAPAAAPDVRTAGAASAMTSSSTSTPNDTAPTSNVKSSPNGSGSAPVYPELAIAAALLDRAMKAGDDSVSAIASAQKMRIYATVRRPDWHILAEDRNKIQVAITAAAALPKRFDHLAEDSTGAERRLFTEIARTVRRSYATALTLFVYTFVARGRGPFEIGADPLPHPLRAVLRSALDCFVRISTLADPPEDVLENWAYALLLLGKFRKAQRFGEKILKRNPANEFAVYIVVEAALQRGVRNPNVMIPSSPADPSLAAFLRDVGAKS